MQYNYSVIKRQKIVIATYKSSCFYFSNTKLLHWYLSSTCSLPPWFPCFSSLKIYTIAILFCAPRDAFVWGVKFHLSYYKRKTWINDNVNKFFLGSICTNEIEIRRKNNMYIVMTNILNFIRPIVPTVYYLLSWN